MSESCDYGNKRDEEIRDRVIVGLNDKTISNELQRKKNLTLADVIETARTSESVRLQNSSSLDVEDDAVTRGQPKRAQQKSDIKLKQPCGKCGYPIHKKRYCPARSSLCHKCKHRGHFASVCKRFKQVQELTVGMRGKAQEHESESGQEYFLGTVTADVEDSEPPWEVRLQVNGKSVKFKIDSDADVTVLSEEDYKHLPQRPLLAEPGIMLESIGGRARC